MGKPTTPGLFVVLSAPSGAGKYSLLCTLREHEVNIASTVSVTTRPPRHGEIDGEHYHFASDAEFDRLLNEDAFAEWAVVHGNRYGTLRSELERCLAAGKDVILELDVQGKRNMARQGQRMVSIFLMPPSLEELERRLRGRDSEHEDDIRVRLENAKTEMAARDEYDYVIVNDELGRAAAELKSVIETERHRQNES